MVFVILSVITLCSGKDRCINGNVDKDVEEFE